MTHLIRSIIGSNTGTYLIDISPDSKDIRYETQKFELPQTPQKVHNYIRKIPIKE